MTKARGEELATTADLSDAARAVVRDAGDPRIDAHLAALGLLPDAPAPLNAPTATTPAEAPELPELTALRATVVELQTALATAGRQVRWLTGALVVAGAGLVIAIALLLSQPR